MISLKALELFGFKSFADRTRFDFPAGVTAVVGPNGSGKSNVVDAIKWVLGEQSARSLRGKEMTDVIFAGSTNRKPLNMAEVSLIFDNRSRELPLPTDEVQIMRRRRTLVAVASGDSGTPPVRAAADVSSDHIREELAARWLPAEALDAARR